MKVILIILFSTLILTGCYEKLEALHFTECESKKKEFENLEQIRVVYANCVNAANMDLAEKEAAYNRWSLKHRASVLYMQNMYTSISLLMVLIVLFFGLAFSFYELKKGKESENTIKVSKEGVEVSSRFLGVIVLVISLCFAYLFLDKAYPVVEIPTQASVIKSDE